MRRIGKDVQRMRYALLALSLLAASCTLPAQAPQQPKPPANSGSNPFPEDTSNVPLMPNSAAGLANATANGDVPPTVVDMPSTDLDPVRSPDDAAVVEAVGPSSGFSSSRSGLDSLLPDPNAPDPKEKSRKRNGRPEPPPHVETAAEDITVAKYYLDNKNWRAALSRYQSAMVLAPEEPDVYWGMAESQRHLGDLTAAKANYQKVIDYDPDSRHAKEAAKLIKSPEMASK